MDRRLRGKHNEMDSNASFNKFLSPGLKRNETEQKQRANKIRDLHLACILVQVCEQIPNTSLNYSNEDVLK